MSRIDKNILDDAKRIRIRLMAGNIDLQSITRLLDKLARVGNEGPTQPARSSKARVDYYKSIIHTHK